MVAAAVAIRSGGAVGEGLRSSDETARVVCVTELAAVCDALAERGAQVTVEDAGVTAGRLAGPDDPGHDAWVTFGPWRDIVFDARRRATLPPLPDGGGGVLARSPLVMVVWEDRATVLEQACPRGLRWRCIGGRAGAAWTDLGGPAAWGPFKPAAVDPTTSATGLLVLGQAAGDFFGTTDFSSRDMDDDRFLGWLTALERGGVALAGSPLQRMLTQGPAVADVYGTTEAEALPLLQRAARGDQLRVVYPEPVAVAEVVAAPLTADGAGRAISIIEDTGVTALGQSGWRVDGQGTVDGQGSADAPDLPAEPNLPSAGVLDALRLRVEEIR